MNNDLNYISTFPVGLLLDIQNHTKFRTKMDYLSYQAKRKNWRAIRNYFNGYLAEWHYPPEGVTIRRCGRGWTRRAAIRRLGIHVAEANAPEIIKEGPS